MRIQTNAREKYKTYVCIKNIIVIYVSRASFDSVHEKENRLYILLFYFFLYQKKKAHIFII